MINAPRWARKEYMKMIVSEKELCISNEADSSSSVRHVEAETQYLAVQVASKDNVQYLAWADGQIIGDASLNRKPRRMSHRGEFGISVRKAYWGCGAASALMEAILAFAVENGFEQINLEVLSDNLRAIRLYEKFGFRKLCTFPAFFKLNGQYIDFDLMNRDMR